MSTTLLKTLRIPTAGPTRVKPSAKGYDRKKLGDPRRGDGEGVQ